MPRATLKIAKEMRNFLFHVDLDCFFAAVEIRENPALNGKPVLVGGNKETRRGVVKTCNYIARKYGIRSGMSALEALTLCPEAICVRGTYDLYQEVSESVMNILSSYSDEFRRASIDEAYLNLTKTVNEEYNGNPIPLAREIKEDIYSAERITCSIGIGPNTTIAKMATAENKPDGITYVPREKLVEFLSPLPVRRVNGIGPKSAKMLKEKHGIETIGQIIALESEHEMIRRFGKLGGFFYKLISGEGKTKVEPNNYFSGKSISKGKTFFGQLEDDEPLTPERVLPRLIDRVHEKLVRKSFRFKTVTLEVRFQKNFKTISRSKSFLAANNDKERIRVTAFELLEEIKSTKEPIRKIAVRVSNFEKHDPLQRTILDFFVKPLPRN